MDSNQKKEHILESAKVMFERYGYEKTSMNDIAKQAGIGKGSIYYYFESKDEIFVKLLQSESDELENLMEDKFKTAATVKEKLKVLLVDAFENFLQRMPLHEHLVREVPHKIVAKLKEFKKHKACEIQEILMELLLEAKEQNILREGLNLEEIAKMVVRHWFFFTDKDIDMRLSLEMIKKFIKDYRILLDLMFYGIFKQKENLHA